MSIKIWIKPFANQRTDLALTAGNLSRENVFILLLDKLLDFALFDSCKIKVSMKFKDFNVCFRIWRKKKTKKNFHNKTLFSNTSVDKRPGVGDSLVPWLTGRGTPWLKTCFT